MRENYERARPLGGLPLHSQAYAGNPDGSPHERAEYELARRNFLALMFCLMVGTAGLPHLLTRYYTAPSVAAARSSVAWSLFFIALLYLSAPALAVLVKFEVMQNLVGKQLRDPAQLDGAMGARRCILAVGGGRERRWTGAVWRDPAGCRPHHAGHAGTGVGCPTWSRAWWRRGGLAAALSTADGLLLTISNALVRDLYYRGSPREASPEQRVILTKFTLLSVALAAAFVAALKPSEILPLVSASFSLAASAFVPVMVLGIFWRGTTRQGAVAGMLAGLGIAVYYMLSHVPAMRAWAGWLLADSLWFGIQPISAGVFGVPTGLVVAAVVSRITRPAPPLPAVRSEM